MTPVGPNGQTGVQGCFAIKGERNASQVYCRSIAIDSHLPSNTHRIAFLEQHTIAGKRLSIHLWDVSTSIARFLRCNCPKTLGSPQHFPSLLGTGAEIARVYIALSEQATDRSSQSMMGVSSYNSISMPSYENSFDHKPVNVSHGAVLTEARGVFITKLSFTVSSSELASLMRYAGQVVDCKIFRDPKTGKSKGTGTVLFSTTTEARRAVCIFDNTEYKGLNVKVRLDREQTTVPRASHPIIADGSTPFKVRSRFKW